MKSDRDETNDPQQTLPPHPTGSYRRIKFPNPRDETTTETTAGGRLRFGTPARIRSPSPDSAAAVADKTLERGYYLGDAQATDALSKLPAKPGVQRWIILLAAGAVALLVIALFLNTLSGKSSDALANDRLMSQYVKYLESKNQQNNVDVNVRRKQLKEKLQAVTWARAVGDRAALEGELTSLLFMDDDKTSPVFQYSVDQLKQLGPSTTTRR